MYENIRVPSPPPPDDHVLKKLNFDLLIPRVGGGGLRAKYYLPCCCIHDFFLFDMQLDHVLLKLNSALMTSRVGSAGKIFASMLLHS